MQDLLIDLDNTVYPEDSNIFLQIDKKMKSFIARELNVSLENAFKIQKKYFKNNGTTLRGLMLYHKISPKPFLDYVHDIDLSSLQKNKTLNNQLKNYKGKKIIFTNGSQNHAKRVLNQVGLDESIDDIFDIVNANYIPKPEISPYNQFIKDFNIDPESTIMFDDIAKNLVPAKNVGFTSVWIDAGYENFSDDIASSKKYLDYETKNISNFLNQVNKGEI